MGTPSIQEPIAIIGMGMRLPGRVQDDTQYWDLLLNGKSGRCRVPRTRYNIDTWYGPDRAFRTVGTKYGYFLEELNLAHIDTGFWSMSREEMELMDPQQRLLLEVVYEAFESSGTVRWRGKDIGVYIGTMGDEWTLMRNEDAQDPTPIRADVYGDYILANRVSYEFDLKGPSMVVRTACSSSLTALHAACQDIRGGACESAVVGGVNLILSAPDTVTMTEQGVLSPEGICRTFDARADGYGRGEAVSAIYIKRLEDAVRDGDPIRAVIRATCISNDGKTPGLTAPDPMSHANIIRKTYRLAGIDDISKTAMVECHGTGTPALCCAGAQVGDPLETRAVASIWGTEGIYIGSVKPNVGHGEGASGLSSILKAVLSLENLIIPPNINFTIPNPQISWETAKLRVPTTPAPWPENRSERVSVNSFGIGGANAHVILESARSHRIATDCSPPIEDGTFQQRLLVFSAKHTSSVEAMAKRSAEYLEAGPEKLDDVAYTLANRRQKHPFGAFCVTYKGKKLQLSRITRPLQSKSPPRVVWAFTGQGAQWAEMGKELIERHPLARRRISELDEIIQTQPNPPCWTLKEEILAPKERSRLYEAEFSQPCLAAIQITLVDLLRSWGVTPDAVVGHSSGETSAAYACGAITAKDAMLLAYHRGKITPNLKAAHRGGMCAVGLGRDQVEAHLREGVIVGCENSPSSVTLSGDAKVLEQVMVDIRSHYPDVLVRALRVECGYHSAHMKTVAPEYASRISNIPAAQTPNIKFYSSVTGQSCTDLSPGYWVKNLLSPVLFSSAVSSLLSDEINSPVFVEIGPHSALAGPLREIVTNQGLNVNYIHTLVRNTDSMSAVLSTAGQLWQAEVPINIGAVNPQGTCLTDLPRYPWRHEGPYWHENRLSRQRRMRKFAHHELLGLRIAESSDQAPCWRCILRVEDIPWLREHTVMEEVVVPAMAYVAMVGEALRQLTGSTEYTLRHVQLGSALRLTQRNTEIITAMSSPNTEIEEGLFWFDFSISSLDGDTWTKHASGRCKGSWDSEPPVLPTTKLPRRVSISSFYELWRKRGLEYGSEFRNLYDVSSGVTKHEAVGTVRGRPQKLRACHYAIHPTSLDSGLHICMIAACLGLQRNFGAVEVPVYIEEVSIRSHDGPMLVKGTSDLDENAQAASSVTAQHEEVAVFHAKGLRVAALGQMTHSSNTEEHGGTLVEWKPDITFCDAASLIKDVHGLSHAYSQVKELASACEMTPAQSIQKSLASITRIGRPGIDNFSDVETLDLKKICSIMDSLRGGPLEQVACLIQQNSGLSAETLANASEDLDCSQRPDMPGQDAMVSYLDDLDYSELFQMLGHKRPEMKVLEIGANGGTTAVAVLQSLKSSYDERLYSSYTYTETSGQNLGIAGEKLKGFAAVQLAALNILEHPLAEASFDLIIVTNPCALRKNKTEALQNIRQLLTERGNLILRQVSESVIRWLGNNSLESGYEEVATLEDLRRSGFDRDQTSTFNGTLSSVFITTVASEKYIEKTLSVVCVDEEDVLVKDVNDHLSGHGFQTTIFTIGQTLPPGKMVLCLLDLKKPFLRNMRPKDFEELKESMLSVYGPVMWVTRASQMTCQDPDYSMTLGFARTLRKELAIDIVTLELATFDKEGWKVVASVLAKFGQREPNADTEYAVSGSQVCISRFHWVKASNLSSSGLAVGKGRTLDLRRARRGPGLCWKQVQSATLSSDQIEVDVKAVGLTQRDAEVARGRSPTASDASSEFGFQGSGIVSATADATGALKVGDRVLFVSKGCFSSRIAISPRLCIKIPGSIGFEQAAALPGTYGLAMYCIAEIGRLRSDQSVLIHLAGGTPGLAAVKVAQALGARVFCTVMNDDQIDYVASATGIPTSRIFSSQNASFLHILLQENSGKGVDLVLNSLTESSLLHASWNCVAPFGMMINIGPVRKHGESKLELEFFRDTRTFTCVDFALLSTYRPETVSRLLSQASDLFRWETVQPELAIRHFTLSRTDAAFEQMQECLFAEQIVVALTQDGIDELPIELEPLVRSDRTYVLVGGLGGLGQATARLLVERGARYLMFFSRSAERFRDTDSWFLQELEAFGCHILLVSGKIEDPASACKILELATQPIGGVMQAAMVLEDSNLADMSFEQWQATVLPKVQGTWNIHHVIEKQNEPLDFFFLFSSLSGLSGQIGQANYAAANSFLDAFVQYRHSVGLACSVLDIGIMEDIGILSREKHRFQALQPIGAKPLCEKDLLDALEWMISPPRAHPSGSYQAKPSTGFVSSGQMAIGLCVRDDSALPSRLMKWKYDPRMLVYHNNIQPQAEATPKANTGLRDLLRECKETPQMLDSNETAGLIAQEIGIALQELLMRRDEVIDLAAPLESIGVDSLVGVELRNWLKHKIGVVFSVSEILRVVSIAELGKRTAERLKEVVS